MGDELTTYVGLFISMNDKKDLVFFVFPKKIIV